MRVTTATDVETKITIPRILHVCETATIGGAEAVFFDVVRSLHSQRFESRALLMADGWLRDRLEQQGIPVRVFKSTRSFDVAYIWRLVRHLRSQSIQLVHSHLPDANAYSSIAGFLARVPVLATYHGLSHSWDETSWKDFAKMRITGGLARQVVAVSEDLKSGLCTRAGMDASKIRVVSNGIDLGPHDQNIDRSRKRNEIGVENDEFTIGMVALMRPVKNHVALIRAAAQVISAIPNTRVILIGKEDPVIKQSLVAEARELGIFERVLFLGHREDVPALLKTLDVFVLCSHSEGHPLATLEAMGSGVPVVVTAVGGHVELIQHGRNGYLTPPGDADSLALHIIKVKRDPGAAKSMAKRASEEVRAKYTLATMVAHYEEMYSLYTGRPGTSHREPIDSRERK